MKKTKILIKTKSKSYPIYFGSDLLNSFGSLIKKNISNSRKICILVDKKLPKRLIDKLSRSLKKYDLKIIKLSSGEKIKNFKFAYRLIENLLKYNLNRSDCIVAFGGGTLGDLSSFVASLIKRGVKFINVPTTLLAQVDSCIGGKTGINSRHGKNLIGTFYQPEFVLIDTSVLNSLPKKEWVGGYGEILKHSLISDKKFFLWLVKNAKKIINERNKNIIKSAIIRSCKIKAKIVSKDEKEKNLRMILNFGHTLAHGFEGASNFGKKLNHGQAVLLGMLLISELSYKKKLLSSKDLSLIKNHYIDLNLPMKIRKFFYKKEIDKIIDFIKKDKKNLDEKINMILLKKIGLTTKPNTVKLADGELKKFLKNSYN